jgi:hypothetical protein
MDFWKRHKPLQGAESISDFTNRVKAFQEKELFFKKTFFFLQAG